MARRRHPRNTSAPITLPLSLSSSHSLLFSFSFCCSPFVRSFAQLVIANVRFLLFLSICRSFPVALNLTSHRWQSGFVYPPLGDVPDNGRETITTRPNHFFRYIIPRDAFNLSLEKITRACTIHGFPTGDCTARTCKGLLHIFLISPSVILMPSPCQVLR